MSKLKLSRSGFTLIELLVVVIIVAVLAAVGLPLLTANVDRARLSEADAGLGTVRTALRAEKVEFGVYPTIIAGNPETDLSDSFNVGDLLGRFFDNADFIINADGAADTFCVGVSGDTAASNAVAKADVAGLTRSMDQDGNIRVLTNCTGTILN